LQGNARTLKGQFVDGGDSDVEALHSSRVMLGPNVGGSINVLSEGVLPRYRRLIAAWFGHHAGEATGVVDAPVSATNVMATLDYTNLIEELSFGSASSVAEDSVKSMGIASLVDGNSSSVARTPVSFTIEKPQQGCGLIGAIISSILPRSEPIIEGVVSAIIDGEIDVETDVDKNGAAIPLSSGSDQYVSVQPLGKRRRRPIRIPVLAGEVSAMLRLRHGYLQETADNALLIRQDAANRVQALRREGDPMFVNLRNRDLLLLVEYSSRMYWCPSADEMDMLEVMNMPSITQRRKDWGSLSSPRPFSN
jgi:hypothetical protein